MFHEQQGDIVIANRYSICASCKKKLLDADKKLHPSNAAEQLQNKYDGQLMLCIPGAKDNDGNKVYLCKSCLKEALEKMDGTD